MMIWYSSYKVTRLDGSHPNECNDYIRMLQYHHRFFSPTCSKTIKSQDYHIHSHCPCRNSVWSWCFSWTDAACVQSFSQNCRPKAFASPCAYRYAHSYLLPVLSWSLLVKFGHKEAIFAASELKLFQVTIANTRRKWIMNHFTLTLSQLHLFLLYNCFEMKLLYEISTKINAKLDGNKSCNVTEAYKNNATASTGWKWSSEILVYTNVVYVV